MDKWLLGLIGGLHLINGAAMWVAPAFWYAQTPGVAMTGPFNTHFVKDIGLIYLLSGAALIFGYLRSDPTALVLGAAWPAMHAAFHFWMWLARGMPVDSEAIVNLCGIQLPAWVALFFAIRFAQKETQEC